MNGKFITIEGTDGVGKSYYLTKLRESGNQVIMDEDLEGFGAEIFHILYTKNDIFYRHGNPLQEFLCFLAVEMQESKKVKSLLKNGDVMKDRGVDTICMYAALQMEGDFLKNYKKLLGITKKVVKLPNLTYVLTDDFEKIVERGQKRIGRSYSEDEQTFLRKVHEGYNILIKEFPKRIKEVSLKNRTEIEIISLLNKVSA